MNPKLSEVTPTTRVAYVKFMSKALSKRQEFKTIDENESKKNEEASGSGEASVSVT